MRVVSFQLEPSFSSSGELEPVWVIRLSVGMDLAFDMLPYPTARRSVLAREVFQDARRKLGSSAERDRGLALNELRVRGEALPDLTVFPSLTPSRLQVDGFLGLDFFQQFDVVE